jgi:hypothetical protein
LKIRKKRTGDQTEKRRRVNITWRKGKSKTQKKKNRKPNMKEKETIR